MILTKGYDWGVLLFGLVCAAMEWCSGSFYTCRLRPNLNTEGNGGSPSMSVGRALFSATKWLLGMVALKSQSHCITKGDFFKSQIPNVYAGF